MCTSEKVTSTHTREKLRAKACVARDAVVSRTAHGLQQPLASERAAFWSFWVRPTQPIPAQRTGGRWARAEQRERERYIEVTVQSLSNCIYRGKARCRPNAGHALLRLGNRWKKNWASVCDDWADACERVPTTDARREPKATRHAVQELLAHLDVSLHMHTHLPSSPRRSPLERKMVVSQSDAAQLF
jgi:hypothetical protein